MEADYLADEASEGAVIARAQRMLDAAKAEGVKIPEQIKPSAKGNTPSDSPAVVILNEAQRLIDAVSRTHISLRDRVEAVQTFWERDGSLRKGKLEEIIAERRAEGEMMKRGGEVDVENIGGAKEDVRAEIGHESGMSATKKDRRQGRCYDFSRAQRQGARQGHRGGGAGEDQEGSRQAEGTSSLVTPPSKPSVIAEAQAGHGKPGGAADQERQPQGGCRRHPKPVAAGQNQEGEARAKLNRFDHVTEGDIQRAWEQSAKLFASTKTASAAQIEAGNYKKGHRTVDGIRLTLENLKGGIRRGIDAAGKAWKARMGADYGYIKKTRGADGDHIDAYDGKRGNKHFIVDQLDAKTGEFDEHKVMLRFKNEAEARAAYEASFSDGKGAQRIGNVHEVSADELKAPWLKSGDGDISTPSRRSSIVICRCPISTCRRVASPRRAMS